MEDATTIASLSLEIDDVSHVIADQDFRNYTRPYKSTLFGTLHLLADGEEITHTNKLPAEFDLIDTVRAQHELIEILEATGTYRAVPFCCVCSDRRCSYVEWAVTENDTDYVSITIEDLIERPIGQSPYLIPKNELYAGFYDFWTKILEFCCARNIQTFEWADRMEPPVSGRDTYATAAEIQTWTTNLHEVLDS